MVSPFGTIPALGRPAGQAHLLARHRADRRRGRADGRRAAHRHPPGRAGARGGHALPQRLRRRVVGPAQHDDDGEPDRPHRQPEHLGHRRRTPSPRCSSSACAARRATRSTTPPATGCPTTPCAPSSSRSTSSAAWATPGPPRPGRAPRASTTSAASSPTSACSTSRRPTAPCGCARTTPASPSTTIVAATGFALDRPRRRGRDPPAHARGARAHPRRARPGLAARPRGAEPDRRRRDARRPHRCTRRSTPSCASASACATRWCRPAWAGWPARAWWPPPPRRAGWGSWPRPP